MGVLTSNVAAALDKTRLSAVDRELLRRHDAETASAYCAGCAHICEEASGSVVPVSDVMRCLMYHRNYGEAGLARAAFAEISQEARAQMTRVDYQDAEQRCPRKLPIARLMAEAVSILA
jgi:predicted aldo/keto reductase-like oxidoreductase